ncbi:metal tolerance protein 11 isoform X1 [Cryptomeria japonica]|uniref:metal tolerance protein 11 isoform X1 n=1 Tax=Cryptomeria japonica TaxID=3369 RepID=UPI0025AC38B5|nr:metal tolerance protein 11 isoform X1 [Cryptomeria japonica]XP_057831677.1 metal tolerance protein 11 isoform X1 [Cryptomeria japonica]
MVSICFTKAIASYYQQQGKMTQGFEEMGTYVEDDALLGVDSQLQGVDGEGDKRRVMIAVWICNLANILLCIGKIYASVRSGSLAIIASTMDSGLNVLCEWILWFTAISLKRSDPYIYPIGKQRMQPLVGVVFASLVTTLSLQILLRSFQELLAKEHGFSLDGNEQKWVVGLMLSITIVKSLLAIYCHSFKNELLKLYAQDHLSDIIINVIGLLAAILANKVFWWVDPAAAILLWLYIVKTWSIIVLDSLNSLIGKTAPPDYLQKLTCLCFNHHKDIRYIDTVRAYTFGYYTYFVEVDIVLPRDMPLQEAHQIGESLQEKLESLPHIQRAFVHLDYEYSHMPEHGKRNI